MKGENFCGLTLNWKYVHGYVDILMPNLIEVSLKKLNFKYKKKEQLAPHEWTVPIYDKNRQFAELADAPPLVNKTGKK